MRPFSLVHRVCAGPMHLLWYAAVWLCLSLAGSACASESLAEKAAARPVLRSGAVENQQLDLRAPLLGVVRSAPMNQPLPYLINAATLGVHRGRGVLAVTPDRVQVGLAAQSFIVQGLGLTAVQSVAVADAQGLTITGFTIAADGSQIDVQVDVAGDAAPGTRRVMLRDVSGRLVPEVNTGATALLVVAEQPVILSVEPNLLERGQSVELLIRGRNLRGLPFGRSGFAEQPQVRITPAAEIVLGTDVRSNDAGTEVRVSVLVNGAASLDDRVLQIITASGQSSANATPANTLQISAGSLQTFTPLLAPALGVSRIVQTEQVRTLSSQSLGVIRGAAIVQMQPAFVGTGERAEIRLSGQQLAAYSSVELVPATGIAIVPGSLDVQAEEVVFEIDVAADASLFSRRVELRGPAGSLAAPQLLEIRAAPPEILAVDPTYVLRDGSTQILEIQGLRLGQTVGASVTPDNGFVIESYVTTGSDRATLRLRAQPGTQLGPRLLQVLGPTGTSSAVMAPSSTLFVADREQILTPVLSAPLGVRRGGDTSTSLGTLFSPTLGVLRGSAVLSMAPQQVPIGESTQIELGGVGLASVDQISIEPADGLTVSGLDVQADGTGLSFDLNVAVDAALGARRVRVRGATTEIGFVPLQLASLEIVDNQVSGPVAGADQYSANANAPLVVEAAGGLLINDSDPLGGALYAVLRRVPTFGTVELQSDGGFVYTPNPDFVGVDQFEYSAASAGVVGAAAVVSLDVSELNDAVDDVYTVDDNAVLNIDAASGLLANDRIEGSALVSISLVSAPVRGQFVVQQNGSFVYTPAGQAGIERIRYRLVSTEAQSLTAEVVITVVNVNEAPVAEDDQYAIERGGQLQRPAPGVMGNDSDPDRDTLTASALNAPAVGALSLNSNGAFSYVPPADFVGEVEFDYEIRDPAGLRDQAKVRIQVNDNLAPVPDAYTMNEGEVLFVDAPGLLANDSLIPQGTLRLVVTQAPPANVGSVQTAHDGSFVFTPTTPHVSGVAVFRYRLEDNAVVSPAVDVRITIDPVNDAPITEDDLYLSDENAELVVAAPGVLDNDTDVDSSGLTASLLSEPSHGSLTLRPDGSFNYVPEVNFRGQDSFQYEAVDPQGSRTAGLVLVDVTQPPTATNDVYAMDVNEVLEIINPEEGLLSNDHDAPENDPLHGVLSDPPRNGTLSFNADGTFVYVPDLDFQGLDTFTYQVSDTRSLSNVGNVTLAVGITSIPRAIADEYEGAEDQTLIVPAEEGVLVNDLDADTPIDQLEAFLVNYDGRNIRQIVVERDGGFRLVPQSNFYGETFFIYQAFDGTDVSNAVRVNVTVLPVNDGVLAKDDKYGVLRNTVLVVPTNNVAASISANDVYDSDYPVNFELLALPQFGELQFNTQTGAFNYTPQLDFAGQDSFTYRVFQISTGIGDTAVVTLRTNGPPIANADTYTVNEDSVNVVTPSPLANDEDPDGDAISMQSSGYGDSLVLVTVDDRSNPSTTTIRSQSHYYGLREIEYSITDGTAFDRGIISVSVLPVPDDPIASLDNYLTQQNTALVVNGLGQGVLGNDYDPDRQRGPGHPPWAAAQGLDLVPLRAELESATSHGSLVFSETGTFAYTPQVNFSGFDEFRYRALDATGRRSPSTLVRIRVNSPAQAVDDAYVVNEDTPLQVSAAAGLLINDVDLDNDPINASFSSNGCHPCNGRVSIRSDGGFTYTPNLNFFGQDEFYYRVTDAIAGFGVGRVAITVLPVNDAPVTEPDTYRTPEDVVLVAPEPQGVLRNDEEVDGEALLDAQMVSPPTQGSVQLQVDGAFSYVPNPDFHGRDTFRYRVFDESGLFSEDEVEVLVTSVNDAPVASDDQYSIDRDQTLVILASEGVLSNDSDVDGPQLSVALTGAPLHGQVELQANGAFTYVPNGVFVGVDQFQYQVDDGLGAVAAAVASIVVRDIAVGVQISVEDDFYGFDAPSISVVAPGVLLNDQASGAQVLTAALVVAPVNGTVQLAADGGFQYQANPGFHGADGFTYAASVGGSSELARVTLDVRRVDNLPPIAVGEQFGMLEDGLLDSRSVGGLLVNDSDFEGAPLTLVLGTPPQHGQLQVQSNGEFTYQPDQNFNGVDQFAYQVDDGILSSSSVIARITVFAQNDAPQAQDDLYQVLQDQTLVIAAALGLLINDSDVDADVLRVELVDAPLHGQVQVAADGSFSYQPLPGFSGIDEFRYAATDGQARALAQVRITVSAPGNQAPVAVGENYTTAEDTWLSGVLTANDSDPDGDALQVLVVDQPEHGTLSLNAGAFEYRPAQDYVGVDRINYRVSDGVEQSAMVTAQITITSVNDAPLAQTDHYLLVQSQSLNVAAVNGVLANDSDVETDPLTASLELAPGHGTVQLSPNGAFVYQPQATYSGRDEFSYLVSDGAASATGRVIIDITPTPNQRPVAIGEAFLLPEDTVLDTRELESLIANDYDPEGLPLTLEILGAPASGVLQSLPDGHVRYTPQRDFHGEVRIDYTVSDGVLAALPVQASIVYTPLNDSPIAQPDLYQLPAAQASLQMAGTQGVLANDLEPDGDTLVATLVRAPVAGNLILGLDGSFQYTPAVPRMPADSFRYRIGDPAGLSDEAEVDLLLDDSPLPDPIFSSGFESPSP